MILGTGLEYMLKNGLQLDIQCQGDQHLTLGVFMGTMLRGGRSMYSPIFSPCLN